MGSSVIAHVDKTVVRITGVKVKGLKPCELENSLKTLIERPIRVIGVTGSSIDMDIYGIEPESIYKDEEGLIKVISAVPGITAADVIKIDSAQRIVNVTVDDIPKGEYKGCSKERWLNIDK